MLDLKVPPILSLEEMDEKPAPGWLVREVVPAQGLVQLFGREGTGKTFVALDLALRVALGRPWHGERGVEAGRVVYVAGEGVQGLKKRVTAWRSYHRASYEDLRNFWVVPEPVQLADALNMNGVVEAIEAKTGSRLVDLIVFDTQARCTAGVNENAAEEMGVVIAGLDWLRAETGAACLLIHHSSYAELARGRGSSAVPGALDTIIQLTTTEGLLTLSCTKQKDWGEFSKVLLRMEPVEESMVVLPVAPRGAGNPELAERLLPKGHAEALAALRSATAAPDGLSFSVWAARSKISLATFKRAVGRLIEVGLVKRNGDKYLALGSPQNEPSGEPSLTSPTPQGLTQAHSLKSEPVSPRGARSVGGVDGVGGMGDFVAVPSTTLLQHRSEPQ